MKTQVARLQQLIVQMRVGEMHQCDDGVMYRLDTRAPMLGHVLEDDIVITDSDQDRAAVTVIGITTIISPRPMVLMNRTPQWFRHDHDTGTWVPDPDATPPRASRWQTWRDAARQWRLMNTTGLGRATPDELDHLVDHVATTLGTH